MVSFSKLWRVETATNICHRMTAGGNRPLRVSSLERASMTKKMDHMEYPKRLRDLSISALRFTIADAQAAMRALPDNPNNSYYADEVCYCANELNRRKVD